MNALEQVHAMYERIERKLREEGRKEGHQEGKAGSLLQLLELRFGTPPEAVIERVTYASIEDIDRWFNRAVGAPTLDDVFAG